MRISPIPFDITPNLTNLSAWERLVSIIKEIYVESEKNEKKKKPKIMQAICVFIYIYKRQSWCGVPNLNYQVIKLSVLIKKLVVNLQLSTLVTSWSHLTCNLISWRPGYCCNFFETSDLHRTTARLWIHSHSGAFLIMKYNYVHRTVRFHSVV